ncbi:MAG: hypothetical protein KKG09_04890 [Verrucomicrobia bacterium]|nr:hypothetical protein [Verrucomicrobiota bacterium]MBU4248545.1 hypothetical protein [Verrucomicrobiota bacterium]MBU4497321.1 hypothetical protein [Verrucomicrobiota bacterium]
MLDETGCAYETAGDPDAAADRYYRAARNLFLAGQTDLNAARAAFCEPYVRGAPKPQGGDRL